MVMQNICTQIIFQGLKLAFIRKLFFHMHAFSHAHTHTQTQINRQCEKQRKREQLLLPYNFGFIKQKLAQHMTRIRLLDLW